MDHRVFLSLVAMLAAFLQLALWPTGCNSPPTIYEERSSLESVDSQMVSDLERELPPIPPSPPVLSDLIPCEVVLESPQITWAMEISPDHFANADPVIADQFDFYVESPEKMSLEEGELVAAFNDLPPPGPSYWEEWRVYDSEKERMYILKFCGVYWNVYQEGYQIYASRLETPPTL